MNFNPQSPPESGPGALHILEVQSALEAGDYAVARERIRALAVSAGMSRLEVATIEAEVREEYDYVNAPLAVLESPDATEDECREAFDEWQRRWEQHQQKEAERRAASRSVLHRNGDMWDAIGRVLRMLRRLP